MDKPTSLRIPVKLRAKLVRVAKKTNTPASEIILASLSQFFAANPTTDSVIEAIVRNRQEQAKERAA